MVRSCVADRSMANLVAVLASWADRRAKRGQRQTAVGRAPLGRRAARIPRGSGGAAGVRRRAAWRAGTGGLTSARQSLPHATEVHVARPPNGPAGFAVRELRASTP